MKRLGEYQLYKISQAALSTGMLVFILSNGTGAAYACRGGRGIKLPAATYSQALYPRPGEISFIGKIIERGSNLRVRVLRRIQGYVPEVVVVGFECAARFWGTAAGDIIPVIAYYETPFPELFGLGSDYHIKGYKFYRGRDIALTIGEQRRFRNYARFSKSRNGTDSTATR